MTNSDPWRWIKSFNHVLTQRPLFFCLVHNVCLIIQHQSGEHLKLFLPYQERGSRNGKGLLVEICTTEEKQDISSVLGLVKLQQLSQLPQLVQVRRELQPARTSHTQVNHFIHSSLMCRQGWEICTKDIAVIKNITPYWMMTSVLWKLFRHM